MENRSGLGQAQKTGEDGSHEDQSRLTRMGGREGCQTLPFCRLE